MFDGAQSAQVRQRRSPGRRGTKSGPRKSEPIRRRSRANPLSSRPRSMPRNADARPPLTLGVVAHSRKENERRLPIHPMHFQRIDADLREHIYLENGYGESFGVTDEQLAPYVRGLRPRHGLFPHAA